MTDRLNRSLAPISEEAWRLIDAEAKRSLAHFLAARSVVDFTGPLGWDFSAQPTGRTDPSIWPVEGVRVRTRRVVALSEVRVPFTLVRDEIDAVEKGSTSPDLDAVTIAARRAAEVEDGAIFSGLAGTEGMSPASPQDPVRLTESYAEYPRHVATAVARLRRAGVEGPYAIALGDRCYTGVIETTEHGGYPVLEHLRAILGGRVVWAPALDGAIVVSIRGGDFEIFSGGDFAVGFTAATHTTVELYLEESFAFVIHEAKAAVKLSYD